LLQPAKPRARTSATLGIFAVPDIGSSFMSSREGTLAGMTSPVPGAATSGKRGVEWAQPMIGSAREVNNPRSARVFDPAATPDRRSPFLIGYHASALNTSWRVGGGETCDQRCRRGQRPAQSAWLDKKMRMAQTGVERICGIPQCCHHGRKMGPES
jgi:hypothetical protein